MAFVHLIKRLWHSIGPFGKSASSQEVGEVTHTLPLQMHLWWGIIQQMRGYLSSSMGLSEMLFDTKLSEEQKDTLNSLQQSHNQMLSILTDMSLFGDLLSSKVELKTENLNLRDLLARLVDLATPELDHIGVSLVTRFDNNLPETMTVESKFVTRILHHLFNQALKSTESGDKVFFSVKRSLTGPSKLFFVIKHSGARQAGTLAASPGRNQIYPFDLELEVVKLMANKMGGDLSAEIDFGYGASFTLAIPVVVESESVQSPEPMEVHPRTSEKLRILVADDNRVERALLEHFLTCPEVELSFAETGRKAVEAFKSKDFDLILMDLQMPEMTGLEATRVIRNFITSDRQPVIVAVTSHAGQQYRDVCLEVGMQGYLTKPVKLENLEELLWRYFPDFYQKMIRDRGNVPFLRREALGSIQNTEGDEGDEGEASEFCETPLNYQALIQKMSGNSRIAKELVSSATREVRELLPDIEVAIRENDKKPLQDLVHKINGILGAIEAHSAIETLEEIREVASHGVPFETRLTVMAMERELDRIDHFVGQQTVETAS